MALTCGFFNSRPNWDRTYSAEQFGSLFGGIIRDGIFANYPNTGDMLVARVGPSVDGHPTVIVGPGRGWFKNTWIDNSSDLTINLQAASSLHPRIDSLFIKIDKTNDVRWNTIITVTGTAADYPVRPNAPAVPTANQGYVFYYRLADIRIEKGATVAASVANNVGPGSGTIPYITGPLETLDSSAVLSRWNADWAVLLQNINTDWGNFKTNARGQIDGWGADWATLKQNINTDWDNFKTDARGQIDETTESYLDSVPNPIQQYVDSAISPLHSHLTSYDQTVKFFLFLHGRRTDDPTIDPYVTNLPSYNKTATYDGATLSWQKWTNSVLPQQKDIFVDKEGRLAEVTAVNYIPDENDNPFVESLSVKTFYDPYLGAGLPNVFFLKNGKLAAVGQTKTYTAMPPVLWGVTVEASIKNFDIVIDADGKCAYAHDIVLDDIYFVSGKFTTFADFQNNRPLIVQFTGSNSCSHTYDQIMAAINAGRTVQFYWNSGESGAVTYALPTYYYTDTQIGAKYFDVQALDGAPIGDLGWYHIDCSVTSNGAVSCVYTRG